jgi:hypothetical protein
MLCGRAEILNFELAAAYYKLRSQVKPAQELWRGLCAEAACDGMRNALCAANWTSIRQASVKLHSSVVLNKDFTIALL